MPPRRLCVLSLRYSSWSMRPWLALRHAGAEFSVETAEVELGKRNPNDPKDGERERSGEVLAERRKIGSVTGLWPVLHVGTTAIHESLAICEWVAEAFPSAGLWPEDPLARARARAVSSEMVSSFTNIRTHLSSHLFGRTTALHLDDATARETGRVFEMWQDALARSGGPFLYGRFSIADCMYYPMRARFRSYGVAVPSALDGYLAALDAAPAVRALEEVARSAPRIPVYDAYESAEGAPFGVVGVEPQDAYMRSVGGDPDAAL